MRTYRTRLGMSFVCAALMCLVGLPQTLSGAVALSTLLNNAGQIVVDNTLVFDQFTFASTGSMPSAASVLVETIQTGDMIGLRFVGGFVDTASAGSSTMDLTYRVSSIAPGLGIKEAAISGNPAIVGGTGSFTITETLSGLPNSLSIFDNDPGQTRLLMTGEFATIVPSTNVQLSLQANASSGAATASFVDQVFRPDDVVPEPGSWVIWLGTMMLVGIVPLTFRRRSLSLFSQRIAD